MVIPRRSVLDTALPDLPIAHDDDSPIHNQSATVPLTLVLAAPMITTHINYRKCFWILVGLALTINVIVVWQFKSFGFFDGASWALWAFIGFAVYSAGGMLFTIFKHFNKVVWIAGDAIYYAAWKPKVGIPICDIKIVEVVDLSIRIETATETKTISRLIVSGKDVLRLLGRG